MGAGMGTGAVGGTGEGVDCPPPLFPPPPLSPPPGLPSCSSGQLTVIFAGPAATGSPPAAVAVAVFLTVPQESSVVFDTMWMLMPSPAPRVGKVQLRTWCSSG